MVNAADRDRSDFSRNMIGNRIWELAQDLVNAGNTFGNPAGGPTVLNGTTSYDIQIDSRLKQISTTLSDIAADKVDWHERQRMIIPIGLRHDLKDQNEITLDIRYCHPDNGPSSDFVAYIAGTPIRDLRIAFDNVHEDEPNDGTS